MIKRITLSLICFPLSLLAQDVEQLVNDAKNILKQDPITINGGISATTVFYDAKGMPVRRDPFYWSVNGNLNINLLGKLSCPLSFTLTQQDKQFSNGLDRFNQPFNQFGISPHYKWLTVHAGYRSMEFSEHSLSGTLFLGGGVEITPEKGLFSGSAAFGRMVRAVPKGGVQGVTVALPAYERWGGAFKFKAGKDKNYAELIYFKAADNPQSIPFDTASNILPAENQVFGLRFAKAIGEKLSLQGAYHYSMFTPNTLLPVTKIERFTYINKIFDPRAGSRFNSSYLFQADYELFGYRLGAKFKRIDPDYTSLGAVFITNDVQEVSGSVGKQFLKNRLSLNFSLGTTRNNLDHRQLATQRRIAMSGNASVNLIPNMSVNLAYNNFTTDVVAIQDVFYDSIRLTQVNETGTMNVNYHIGKEIRHGINLNSTYQESGGNKQLPSTVFMLNPSYTLTVSKINMGFTVAGTYTRSDVPGNETVNVGPTIGVNTSFFHKKCKVAVNATCQYATINSVKSNENYALTGNLNYALTTHQSLKVNYAFIHKKAVVAGAQDYIENRMTIAYSYSFGSSYNKIKARLSAAKKDE